MAMLLNHSFTSIFQKKKLQCILYIFNIYCIILYYYQIPKYNIITRENMDEECKNNYFAKTIQTSVKNIAILKWRKYALSFVTVENSIFGVIIQFIKL